MGAKEPQTILDRMRQAVADEWSNGRRIIHWRISPDLDLLYRLIYLDNKKTPTAYINGEPCVVVEDWHGFTFEYDTADVPQPVYNSES